MVLLSVPFLHAKNIRLEKCPPAVQATIQRNLYGREIEKIKEIKINDYSLYLVEVNVKGFRDATLYVSGDGTLRKIVEEIRFKDLPEEVQKSVLTYVSRKGKVEDVERVLIRGEVLYQVEIEPPKGPDQILVFEPDGSISSEK
ncbi:MAG: hypothetical protein AAGF67_01940 [Verrucomicrobiota bacterium]